MVRFKWISDINFVNKYVIEMGFVRWRKVNWSAPGGTMFSNNSLRDGIPLFLSSYRRLSRVSRVNSLRFFLS